MPLTQEEVRALAMEEIDELEDHVDPEAIQGQRTIGCPGFLRCLGGSQ